MLGFPSSTERQNTTYSARDQRGPQFLLKLVTTLTPLSIDSFQNLEFSLHLTMPSIRTTESFTTLRYERKKTHRTALSNRKSLSIFSSPCGWLFQRELLLGGWLLLPLACSSFPCLVFLRLPEQWWRSEKVREGKKKKTVLRLASASAPALFCPDTLLLHDTHFFGTDDGRIENEVQKLESILTRPDVIRFVTL